MKLKKSIYLLTTALTLAILSIYSWVVAKNLEEKKHWAFLQSTEYAHRYEPREKYRISNKESANGYLALGVPTTDPKRPMAWILINDDIDNPIKILLQNANISLHCKDIESIINDIKINTATVKFLRSKCQKNGS